MTGHLRPNLQTEICEYMVVQGKGGKKSGVLCSCQFKLQQYCSPKMRRNLDNMQHSAISRSCLAPRAVCFHNQLQTRGAS